MSQMDPAAQVRLLLRLTPRAGKADELSEAVKSIVLDVLQEPGCLSYVAHKSGIDRDIIVIYEGWVDQQAFEHHYAGHNFLRLSQCFGELLDREPLIETLHRIA